MPRNLLFHIILIAGIAAFSYSCSDSKTPDVKPNILFMFIDDMGYGDLACYGNQETETPNIDRLASEGIRFTQFYVNAPICSPSRVAVTTGQYPPRWGITSFISNREHNSSRGINDYLKLEAPSLAQELSANGYYTAHIGKWHMGGGRDIGDVPFITEYGFDESVTQFEGLGERYLATYETLDLGADSTRGLEKQSAALGKGEVHWEKRYNISGRFVDRAIVAIENAKEAQKPFYINLWPDDVHTPVEPSPSNRGDGSRHDHYIGVIKELDREFGRIINYIRDNDELAANTIIVLTSDNGPAVGVGSAGPLRGTKTNLYEGGIREPFIVWSPDRIDESSIGTVNTINVIAGMDLPPTLLALAGVKHDIPFDGIDVSKAFLGEKCPERNSPVMWQRPPDINIRRGIDYPDLAIREGDFKLLINTDSSGVELYNIVKDEAETINLSEDNPELVKSLSEKVLDWYSTMPPIVNQN
jgi:arylsulfatase A-like enzyme